MTNLGMIGLGKWGKNWLRTLATMGGGTTLKTCCDSSESARQRAQNAFPSVNVTDRFDSMLNDDSIEGIVIATSAPSHFELAESALLAGKNILVEKPLTLHSWQSQRLVELAHTQKCTLLVGHLLEYHPAIVYIREMIERGDLGDILYIYSQRLNLGTIRKDENAWWSLAPHDISVACRLIGGQALSVQCQGQGIVQPRVEDVVFGTIEFNDKRLAHIHVSWLDPHKTRKLTVVGSERMVVMDDTLPAYKVTVYDKSAALNDQHIDHYADWVTLRQGDIVIPRIDSTEPLLAQARHFVECIRGETAPLADGKSGLEVVTLLECGQKSLQQNGLAVSTILKDNSPTQTNVRRAA